MRRVAGFFVAALGVGLVLLDAVSLLDPAGTQLADDANPFGEPPIAFWALGAVAGVAMVWIGARLFRRGDG